MNSCDFCKRCWISAAILVGTFGILFGIVWLVNLGKNEVCFSAQLQPVHVHICDNSAYPGKE